MWTNLKLLFPFYSQAQEVAVDSDLALLQEREERIRQLESDILDVNEIFRDLGALVHEQGDVIDTIEANVEQTHGNVEAGNEQLVSASRYQRKARKKMCILAVVLVVIAGVLALIIYLSVKNWNTSMIMIIHVSMIMIIHVHVLGPVYTKCQRQRCDNSAMKLAILFSLKTMESLKNGLQPNSGVTPLFSMRTVSLASSQSCCCIDADAGCKQALNFCDKYYYMLFLLTFPR